MRGLGIGILVTAGILILTDTGASAMSDDEIREKARTLGMTDNVVLSQMARPGENDPEADTFDDIEAIPIGEDRAIHPIPEENPTPEVTPEPTSSPESTLSLEPTSSPEVSPTPEVTPEPTSSPEASPTPSPDSNPSQETGITPSEAGEEITIRINSGDDSFRVSNRLAEAGLVLSASEYNQYLMDNGHSRRLRVGNHLIPTDADYEAIALILTGR